MVGKGQKYITVIGGESINILDTLDNNADFTNQKLNIVCDTTNGFAINILLPDISAFDGFTNFEITVDDKAGNASVGNINILTSGTNKINGAASMSIITNFGKLFIQISSTSDWSGFSTTGSVNPNLFWKTSGNTLVGGEYIGTNSNDDFPIYTNGTEKARFLNTGEFVLGETTSTGQFIRARRDQDSFTNGLIENNFVGASATAAWVAKSDTVIAFMGAGSSINASLPSMGAIGTVASNLAIIAGIGGPADMIFYNGGTAPANEHMRITSTGDVGIGTDTPLAKFQVVGLVSGTTILGSVLDNLGGWTHTATVSGGNGFLFLEAGGSTNDLTKHRIDITGGDGGHINVFNTLGVQKVKISGAVGTNHLVVENDAGSGGFEVGFDGNIIMYQQVKAGGIQTGNGGLLSGDLYVDSAANILANGDVVLGRKV